MSRTLALLVVLVLAVQSCCTCDHRARLPIVAATEVAQHEAVEWGMDLRHLAMSFDDTPRDWEANFADIPDDDQTMYGPIKRRLLEADDYYLISFWPGDEECRDGVLHVYVGDNPPKVLGAWGSCGTCAGIWHE